MGYLRRLGLLLTREALPSSCVVKYIYIYIYDGKANSTIILPVTCVETDTIR